MKNEVSFKPSAYYFRRALRNATSIDEAVEIGFHVVSELETLKQWVREQGLIPPKWHLMRSERDEKNWGDVVRWQSSEKS